MPKIKLPYTEASEELIEDVKADVEAIGGEVIYPTSNAQDRNQIFRNSDEVGTGVYKEGGKVDVTDIVKRVEQKEESRKFLDKRIIEADKKGETISGGGKTYPKSEQLEWLKKGHVGVGEDQIKRMKKKILKKKKGKKK
jgi:hypothetical protein